VEELAVYGGHNIAHSARSFCSESQHKPICPGLNCKHYERPAHDAEQETTILQEYSQFMQTNVGVCWIRASHEQNGLLGCTAVCLTYRRFGGKFRLHLQGEYAMQETSVNIGGQRLYLPSAFTLVSSLVSLSILNMEATCCTETSLDFQRATRCYIPEVITLHSQGCENLKLCALTASFRRCLPGADIFLRNVRMSRNFTALYPTDNASSYLALAHERLLPNPYFTITECSDAKLADMTWTTPHETSSIRLDYAWGKRRSRDAGPRFLTAPP
jgi:hypothetical protein